MNLFNEYENKKTCIFFYSNLLYKEGLNVLIKSLITENPKIREYCDFVLGYTEELGLNYFDYEIKIDKENYKEIKIHPDYGTRYIETFYKLEAFNLSQYKKIILIESDILCVGSIMDLLYKYNEKSIYGVKHHSYLQNISPGVMVINDCKKFNVAEMIKLSKEIAFPGDDDLLNFWISKYNIDFGYIDIKYNFVLAWSSHLKMRNSIHDIRLVHFGGEKPWLKFDNGEFYHKKWKLINDS